MPKAFKEISENLNSVILELTKDGEQVILKSGQSVELILGDEKFSYVVPENKILVLSIQEISGVLFDE